MSAFKNKTKKAVLYSLLFFFLFFSLSVNIRRVEAADLSTLFTTTITQVGQNQDKAIVKIKIETQDLANYDAVEDNATNPNSGFYVKFGVGDTYWTGFRYVTSNIHTDQKINEFLVVFDKSSDADVENLTVWSSQEPTPKIRVQVAVEEDFSTTTYDISPAFVAHFDPSPVVVTNNNSTNTGDWQYYTNPDHTTLSSSRYPTEEKCRSSLPPGPGYGPCVQTYTLLQPIPNGTTDLKTFAAGEPGAFARYFNIMFKLFIGICAVLAMVMIVWGGIEYITSELISGKEAGKERVLNAVFGLLLALGAFALLNTINPQLLDIGLNNLPQAIVRSEDEPETGITSSTINLIEKSNGNTVVLSNCDTSKLVTATVFGHSVQVYKGVKPSLERINTAWLAHGGASGYEVKTIFGYNCRRVKNQPNSWSAHAFGVALDINPQQNPYGTTQVTDMPSWFRQLFITEGWGWGGNWSNPKDAMHFSKYPSSEGGDKKVETI